MGRYNYTNALEKLRVWANKEGYKHISFDHDDTSYIDWVKRSLNTPKEIGIEGKYSTEEKVYLLLHELGHHLLRKDWEIFERILPISAYAESMSLYNKDERYKRRVDYIVSCMEEEFRAWDEGNKLGNRLGIRINEIKWNEIKTKCLMSYIRYYGKK